MTQEVITINVGECGVQFGHAVWKQYCTEYDINQNGTIQSKTPPLHKPHNFFEETSLGRYVARGIMVDTDPDIMNTLQNLDYKHIYDSKYQFITGNENCASFFNRGHYTVGKDIIDKVNDRIRRLCDNCDNLQGFIINFAVGGGTGSGLGCLILERIAVDYRKKSTISFNIYPFNNHQSKIVVEPYNALLVSHWLLDHTEISIVFENSKLFNLCKNQLSIPLVTYNDMNLLMAKVESSFTAPIRHRTGPHHWLLNESTLEQQQRRMVPVPRLHFIIPSMAPLINRWKFSQALVDGFVRMYYPSINVRNTLQFEHPLYKDVMVLIYGSYTGFHHKYVYDEKCDGNSYLFETNMYEICVNADNFMIEAEEFNVNDDLYMALTMNCHGDISSTEVNENMMKLQNNNSVKFVEWTETGLFVELYDNCIGCMDEDTIACNNNVVMFGNNTFIGSLFAEITKKYDKMYYQRAYVHWYVGEGMSEGEFAESREDLEFLCKDYEDVLQQTTTDENDDQDED